LAADVTEHLSFSPHSAQRRFGPSPATATLGYDFDGGMFDARVEAGGFDAFAGSWIGPVEVGKRFTVPRGRLERMVAKAGNPPVLYTRSRAGRGVLEVRRPKSEGRKEPEVRRPELSASSPFRHRGIGEGFDWAGPR